MPELLPMSFRAKQGPRASGENAGEGNDGLHLDLEVEYHSSEYAEPSINMHIEALDVCIGLSDFSRNEINGYQDILGHRYPA